MGMFDSIYLEMKCPYCGEQGKLEAQTKELECELNKFKKGDFIGTNKYNYLRCTASCLTGKCKQYEKDNCPYRIGFGYIFEVKVFLNNGVVTGDYEIIEDETSNNR